MSQTKLNFHNPRNNPQRPRLTVAEITTIIEQCEIGIRQGRVADNVDCSSTIVSLLYNAYKGNVETYSKLSPYYQRMVDKIRKDKGANTKTSVPAKRNTKETKQTQHVRLLFGLIKLPVKTVNSCS